jgi:hypothetical protein
MSGKRENRAQGGGKQGVKEQSISHFVSLSSGRAFSFGDR